MAPMLALLAPGVGHAAIDTKSYPAAICQAAGTSQNLDYWWGRVVNRSSGTRVADCPVVKDRMTGLTDRYVEFRAIDRNPYRNVRCAIYNLDHYTVQPWRGMEWNAQETSGSYGGMSTRRIYWGDRKTHINGSFLFGCLIPGRHYVRDDVGSGGGYVYSELVGFKVVENVIGSSYGQDWD
jgi:hypothetical protein